MTTRMTLLSGLAISVASWGWAGVPVAVSPGRPDRLVAVEQRCPTFSWGAVAAAGAYELVVFALPEGVSSAAEADLESAAEVLSVRLPGGATSWTPGSDQCLAAGGRYVWFVRTPPSEGGPEGAPEWSDGLAFAVAATPEPREVEAALEVLRRHLEASGLRLEVVRPDGQPVAVAVAAGGRSVPSAPAAVRGDSPDTVGEVYGVAGTSASPSGAGLAAANTNPAGGPDLVLDGWSQGLADTRLSESGVDRPSASDQTFTLANSGAGLNGQEAVFTDAGGTLVSVATTGIGSVVRARNPTFNPLTTGAPFVIGANGAGQLVTGLDADSVDGNDASAFATAAHHHDSTYWKLAGNAGTTPGAQYLGTADGQALELKVSGARALRLEPDATCPNVVGGHAANSVTAGMHGATIGGGGAAGLGHSVTNHYGTIGGGRNNEASAYGTVSGGGDNTASGLYSTVGGGQNNTATYPAGDSLATVGGGGSNTASGFRATVGGGYSNTAGGESSTVGAGDSNTASGFVATVGGGHGNTASGSRATVPGGRSNVAFGDFSFAAGRRAKANHNGSFVWGDSTDADLATTANDQFLARSSGGVIFFSNSTATQGVTLAPGGGSWASVSDRALKAGFEPVDPRAVLERVAVLPVQTWSYQSQDPAIRHIGPVAQDFHDAFGVGEDDRHITAVDADGVALAAIQGLYQVVEERDARIQALEAENAGLEARLAALERAARDGR